MHNGVGPTKVISTDTGPGRPRFTALQWPRQADPVVRGLARTRKNWLWFPSDFTRYLKQHPIHVLILAVQCSLQGHTAPARGLTIRPPATFQCTVWSLLPMTVADQVPGHIAWTRGLVGSPNLCVCPHLQGDQEEVCRKCRKTIRGTKVYKRQRKKTEKVYPNTFALLYTCVDCATV